MSDGDERPAPEAYPRALAVLLHLSGVAFIGLAVLAARQLAEYGLPLIAPEDRDMPLLVLAVLLIPLAIGRRRFLETTAGKLVGAAGLAYGLTYVVQAQPSPEAEWAPPLVFSAGVPWVLPLIVVLGIAWLVAVGGRRVRPAATGYEWPAVLALGGFAVLAILLYYTVARHYEYEMGYFISAALRAVEFGLVFLVGLSAVGARGVGPAVHLYASAVLIAALAASAMMAPGLEAAGGVGWWPA